MKKFLLLPAFALFALALAGCMPQPTLPIDETPTTGDQVAQYNAESWKEIIPDSCQSFYDGCNHCNKMGDNSGAACTKMFCEVYSEPYCKDEENVQIANPASTFCLEQGGTLELSGSVGYCVLSTGERHEEWEYYRANNTHTSEDIYIGLSVDEATVEASKRGVPFRIVEIDGQPQAVTMDLRPGRINAVVNNGFVTSFSVEGGAEIM